MISTNYLKAVSQKDPQTGELTVGELACAIYEGMPHVQNLAEKMNKETPKANVEKENKVEVEEKPVIFSKVKKAKAKASK